MATFTAKLGLRKPAGSDLVTVATDLNANYDLIDAAVSTTIYTSVTRPASPFQGQQIYETDTQTSLMWTGSAWLITSMGKYQTYIPGLSGVTLGTGGTQTGKYWRVGNNVKCFFDFVLGTGGSVGGNIGVGLPFTAINTNFGKIGSADAFDVSVGTTGTRGMSANLNTTTAVLFIPAGSGGIANGTNPFTWAVGDELRGEAEFEAVP